MSQVLTGISSIPISAASAGYAPTNTGEVGNMINSAVSGLASTADLSAYLATSSIGVDSASAITSIAGSSIAGGGATGDYVPTSATEVNIGVSSTANYTAFVQGVSSKAEYKAFVQGTQNTARYYSFAQGVNNTATTDSFAQGEYNTALYESFAQGHVNHAESSSFAQGAACNATSCSFAQGHSASARNTGVAIGETVKAYDGAVVFGKYNKFGTGDGPSGIAFEIGDGTGVGTALHSLLTVRKNGEITVYSSTADTTGVELVSTLNSKLDSSASSSFVTSTAGLASTADLSAYLATSSIGVDSASAITSIAGSSIAGGGTTGDYVSTSATSVVIGSGNNAWGEVFIHGVRNWAVGASLVQGTDNTGAEISFAQGEGNNAYDNSFAQGHLNSADNESFAQGEGNSADNFSFAQGNLNSANDDSFAQGEGNSADGNSFAHGLLNSASNNSFAKGYNVTASATAAVFGTYNLDGQGSGTSGIALAFGDGTATTAKHNLFEFRKDGTLTLYSSTADTTGLEVRSALNSKLDASAEVVTGWHTAYGTASMGPYVDRINDLRLIARYAEEDISGRDLTALASTADLSAYQPTSSMGAYQTTAGMSAYASTSDLSAKLDASASSSFLTAQEQASWSETATDSPSYIVDKPDLVDIVAGPGIVVDNPDGNTLRVSTDSAYETVLWENTGTTAVTSMTLSEDVRNFDRFRVYWLWNNGTDFMSRVDEFSNLYTGTTHRAFCLDGIYRYGGTTFTVYSRFVLDTSYSSITYEYSNQNNDTAKYIVINKIVGIHRIANN